MKTKFKRIGKQSLSVILAVMMMVSTMLVGMVSTNAEATVSSYKFVFSNSQSNVSSCDKSAVTALPVTIENDILTVTVNTSNFTKNGNWYFTFAKKGISSGIVSLNNDNDITVDTSLKDTFFQNNNGCFVQQDGDYKIVRADVKNPSAVSALVISYNLTAKTFNISAPVESHNVKLAEGSSTNATVKIGDSALPVSVTKGNSYSLTVTPADSYYITKVTVGGEDKFTKNDDNYSQAKTSVTIFDLTMNTTDVEVKVETAQIVKPTVTVITGSNQVEFGNTIPLTPKITYNVDKGDVTITDQAVTVEPNSGNYEVASTDSEGVNTYSFTAPLSDGESASASITYTVTYTVTLSNGETATGTKVITANFTNEQSAYKALKTGLGTATYPAPTTYTTDNYPQSLIDAYATEYTAASVVNTDAFPAPSEATTYQDLKSALDTAKSALLAGEKTSLEKPVLVVEGKTLSDGKYNVTPTDTVTIKVNNTYPEAANLTYQFYDASNGTLLHEGSSYNPLSLSEGEHKYYVTISTTSENYKIPEATSETIIVNVVGSVKVTVSAGENGSAYISEYTDINGTKKTGTASIKSVDVLANSSVTFTAVPNSNFIVASWDGNTSEKGETYTKTVSEDTTVNVTFEENLGVVSDKYHLMYSSNDDTLTGDSSGNTVMNNLIFYKDGSKYKVTVQIDDIQKDGNHYFAFTTGTGATAVSNMVGSMNKKPTASLDASSTEYLNPPEVRDKNQKIFVYFGFKNYDDLESLTFIYDENANAYTLIANVTQIPENAKEVYATKGSESTLKFGNTTITVMNGKPIKATLTDTGDYNKYIVNNNDKITVNCEVTAANAALGYYVFAFVVNGNKVDVQDMGNGVYQTKAPITVTENLEITPVYYNSNIDAAGDYITVYFNDPKKDLISKWGNSISVYSWYHSKGEGNKEMEGAYPGQLMMRDSQGKYFAKVSRYFYKEENGKFTKHDTLVKGVTFSNYSEKRSLHQQFLKADGLDSDKNYQTYDYSDFLRIANMGYDTVQFDVKYQEAQKDDKGDEITNQKKLISNEKLYYTPLTEVNKTYKRDLHVTEMQKLTNIDGEAVSILGYTKATAKQQSDNNNTGLNEGAPLKIISVGNQSDNLDKKNATTKWYTVWYVYNSADQFITAGLPSDFIPTGTLNTQDDGTKVFKEDELEKQSQAYQDIVKKGYKYNTATISYEVEQDASSSVDAGNTGIRIDGRWYYARSGEKINLKTGILYKTSNDDSAPWLLDKTANPNDKSDITGTATGATASFTYVNSAGTSYSSRAFDDVERNADITLNALGSTKYKFVGWATADFDENGKVIKVDTKTTEASPSTKLSQNTVYYALFEPYPVGQLTLQHLRYDGPDAHNGLGLFEIEAKQYDSNNTEVNGSTVKVNNDGSVTVNGIINTPGNYVSVTLKTESYANSRFYYFYVPKITDGKIVYDTNGEITYQQIKDENHFNQVCDANNKATYTFNIPVSALFKADEDTQTIMGIPCYSDLKLPEVASDITFNYGPYTDKLPGIDKPDVGKGTGKTLFSLTITDDSDNNNVVYETKADVASLTLKGNVELKTILEKYMGSTGSNDYTITLTLKPQPDSKCSERATYIQTVGENGNYTYADVKYKPQGAWNYTYNSENNKYTATAKLSALFDKEKQEFKSNTINFYTDFTAKSFDYNVTFKYHGYESRDYYDKNGYTQNMIPDSEVEAKDWWKTYTATGTFYGADIDKYFNYDADTRKYTFKEAFLLKVAPYEDNFVQTILWDLDKVEYTEQINSIVATVTADYKNSEVTVTAVLPDRPLKLYTVNYGSLVIGKNLIKEPTESEDYLIVAPDKYNNQEFSYWTIEKVFNDNTRIEVAKCYNRKFNYIAYDNYTVTACYGRGDVESAKQNVSATMTFLEYSRNQYDTNKDKVYADFAVSFDYYDRMLNSQTDAQNSNVICGVAFVVNNNYSSKSDAEDKFEVSNDALLAKIKELNGGNPDKVLSDGSGSKVYNYKIDKKDLDNKNRIEFSWNVDNSEVNNNLTILAYSYIYNTTKDEIYCISTPQSFKFYNVGHKTYKN